MSVLDKIHNIPLNEIEVSEFNVRIHDRNSRIEELAESINKHGLLQPVVLKGPYGSPPYELIVGQRRFLAHKKLNKDTILSVFCDETDDIALKILSLSENMHRLELNHADKAEAITALYKHYRKDISRLSRVLGISIPTIRDYIKIEEQATDKAKRLLAERKVSKEDVKRVIDAAQGDNEKADRLLDKMEKLSKYEKTRAVDYGKSHPDATGDEIIEVGKKPQFRITVVLNLTKEIDKALSEAKEKLSKEIEVIAVEALEKWLKDNGFLKQ